MARPCGGIGVFPCTVRRLNRLREGNSWEKHIREETFCLEGLEKEYTLLFLTDTHVIIRQEDAPQQEADNEASRYPAFQNEEGVPSEKQFPEWIRFANEMQVDAVLLGGDIIDTPSEANLKWLEEQLSGLNMPYLYVNGNHDWTYPWEYMTETGRETYLPLLAPFMQDNTAIHSLDFGEFTVVGIDDSANQVDGGRWKTTRAFSGRGGPSSCWRMCLL